MKAAAAVLALLLLVAGCRTAVAPESDAPRRMLSAGTGGVPGYSVAIPPDLVPRDVQGIDSEVAAFEGPGLRLGFDYGWYGGFTECAARPSCREWEETIDGRIWRFSEGAPDIDVGGRYRRFLSARVRLGGSTTLAVGASCVSPADCERALAIVRTVRFAD